MKNTDDFFVQVRNILLPLSLKVLRHKVREAQSFYSGFFICPTPHQHVWHPPQRSLRASESQPFSLEAALNSLTDFFEMSQNPPRASGA